MRRLLIGAVMVMVAMAGCGGDDKPTAPPSGSCCLPNGTCTVTTQASCTGAWVSGGVCDPNTCVQPTGSCCASAGTCAVTLQAGCAATSTWTMFGACDANPCLQPDGACCGQDGTCAVTKLAVCIEPSTWTMFGVCDPNPCAQPDGACCAPDGSCSVTTAEFCTGTSVWTMFGICDPNPCPPPSGACCAPDGTCMLAQQADCTGGSTWTVFGVCDPNPCPPPASLYLPQTSPANVLINLQISFQERAIDEYRRLLSDDFTFVFNPADVMGSDPTPAQWGLADELAAMGNMFRSEIVNRIELTSYVLGAPERVDSLYFGPRAWKVRVDAANFMVWTQNQAGEPLIYIVEGTTEVFYFREDPSRQIGGRPTWFVFRWEDQPIGGVKTERASWGAVKNLYR